MIVAGRTYLRKPSEHDIMKDKLYIENLEKGDIMLENDIKKFYIQKKILF